MAYAVRNYGKGRLESDPNTIHDNEYVTFDEYIADSFKELPVKGVKIGDRAMFHDGEKIGIAMCFSAGWVSEGKFLPIPDPSDESAVIYNETLNFEYNESAEMYMAKIDIPDALISGFYNMDVDGIRDTVCIMYDQDSNLYTIQNESSNIMRAIMQMPDGSSYLVFPTELVGEHTIKITKDANLPNYIFYNEAEYSDPTTYFIWFDANISADYTTTISITADGTEVYSNESLRGCKNDYDNVLTFNSYTLIPCLAQYITSGKNVIITLAQKDADGKVITSTTIKDEPALVEDGQFYAWGLYETTPMPS